jgi:hypothetical protein
MSNLTVTIYVLRDAVGAVLYVGLTTDLHRRFQNFGYKHQWFREDVADVRTYDVPLHRGPTEEADAIRQLRPLHNRAGLTSAYKPPNADSLEWFAKRALRRRNKQAA